MTAEDRHRAEFVARYAPQVHRTIEDLARGVDYRAYVPGPSLWARLRCLFRGHIWYYGSNYRSCLRCRTWVGDLE